MNKIIIINLLDYLIKIKLRKSFTFIQINTSINLLNNHPLSKINIDFSTVHNLNLIASSIVVPLNHMSFILALTTFHIKRFSTEKI